jgi:hypothetical protein
VTERSARRHQALGAFRVTPEVLPDGRQMHYYEWPASAPDGAPPDFDAVKPAPSSATPDEAPVEPRTGDV